MPEIRIDAAATRFFISTTPAMPEITLTAVVTGAPAPPASAFRWTFALAYPGFITIPGSHARRTTARTHPAMTASGNPVQVPFALVTGGRLTATVQVLVRGTAVSATRADILIGGTNPTAADLATAVPDRLMRQLVQQESGGAQFNDGRGGLPATSINPNWSQDNRRGVGLGQLTVPPPTPEETWNWRTNAAALQARFRGKRSSGTTLHTRVAESRRFGLEVATLNSWRRAEGQPPLAVTLPALTSEQLDREGLRAYNGFGSRVAGQYLPHIHEYEPTLTTLQSATRRGPNGRPLQSRVPEVDARGVGSWSQISGAERRARSGGSAPGDPDYVENVLRKPG